LLSYGFLVGLPDQISTSKGCNQHQQRCSGQVKIGNKGINYLKLVPRHNEQVNPAFK